MTYKQQMEKSIKQFLTQKGFKYDTRQYAYSMDVKEDVAVKTSYATQSCNRKEYYRLVIYAEIFYKQWNDVLAKLTEGCTAFKPQSMGVIFFPTTIDYSDEHVTFTSERTMDENLSAFQKELETKVFPVVEKYTDKRQLYEDLLHEEDAYLFESTSRWFLPIACYMFGDYEDSLSHAKRFLQESKDNLQRVPDSPGFRNILDTYQIYYKNLGALIQKRQNK